MIRFHSDILTVQLPLSLSVAVFYDMSDSTDNGIIKGSLRRKGNGGINPAPSTTGILPTVGHLLIPKAPEYLAPEDRIAPGQLYRAPSQPTLGKGDAKERKNNLHLRKKRVLRAQKRRDAKLLVQRAAQGDKKAQAIVEKQQVQRVLENSSNVTFIRSSSKVKKNKKKIN